MTDAPFRWCQLRFNVRTICCMVDRRPAHALAIAALLVTSLAACGDEADPVQVAPANADSVGVENVRLVSPTEAATIVADPPDGLVVLDVRTPEEFASGHLDGAAVVDFYSEDFADQLAGLDRSVPYVVYCQSGNRSGQATAMMAELGFTDVVDVDGGIAAWAAAELEIVGP